MTANDFHSLKIRDKENAIKNLTIPEKENLLKDQIKEICEQLADFINKTNDRFDLEAYKGIVENSSSEEGVLDSHITSIDNWLYKYKWANQKIDYSNTKVGHHIKVIYQYDIFMCDIGENIGIEKSKARPVIILSKNPFIDKIILIAPITTTKPKSGNYIPINEKTKWNNATGYVDLDHIRSIDKIRLSEKAMDSLKREHEQENPIQNLFKSKLEKMLI